jgi:hypothetical protein
MIDLLSPPVALNISWAVLIVTAALFIGGLVARVRHHQSHQKMRPH